ncbi:hypothetical protein Pint_06181 [Pistacia integerrima]|uniref:Uncharacterized protein n=1 Tax=Pistacia integerrima TaxID=434235 RepID=A0ACC0Z0P4_9ROSI|nr:hypothetical protein Pint_06181 [Pistacia integerrima]
MSNSTSSSSLEKQLVLDADEDSYGGVTVNMEKPMDSKVFTSMLRTSLSYWRQQVLVVKERSGQFGGTRMEVPYRSCCGEELKFYYPQGEDIWTAAIREVKEETGVDTEFVEVFAFRQSHRAFFRKSDLMFVCMLRPCSSDIQKQDSEIEAARWMAR